jgi:hypothetical protein
MIFTYHEIKKLPIVVIDQFYSADACDRIWHELCFLNNGLPKLNSPQDTGSAWEVENDKKIYLKQNKGIFLDEVYSNRKVSDILIETDKIFSKEVVEKLIEQHLFFKYIKDSTANKTLMSYYEDSDQYLPHGDVASVTAVSWFFKKPKAFVGGDLIIEHELTVDCFHNRMIVFPSILLHSVTPVKIEKEFSGRNFGRYAISKFISSNV